MARTAARARPAGGDTRFLLTGQKQFGSGSGISAYMITIAMVEGETSPSLFFMDMRGVPWDGSAGATLVAPWDGHGMAATQSHAMAFKDFPATRSAWPAGVVKLMEANAFLISAAFTAVVVGIAETAVESARQQVARRRDGLRAYEKVEWARAEMEGWLIQQAYEGMLRAIEERQGAPPPRHAGEDGHRRAGRVRHRQDLPRHRGRHLQPLVALRPLARGRARPRLPTPPVGPRLRQHFRLVRYIGFVGRA